MSIEEILQANAKFVQKYGRIKVPPGNGWVIVTCSDRRLSGLLEAAMGFNFGEAHVIRTAGNTVTPYDNSIIRSLSILTLQGNIKNIAVVGHTDCLTKLDTAYISNALASKNLNREKIPGDLREFYGLTNSPSSNIRATIDMISKCGLLPAGINIYGLVIETTSGKLSLVYEGSVEPLEGASLSSASFFKRFSDSSSREIIKIDKIRGQDSVRQAYNKIEVPKAVNTPTNSVKVPVNIRTPVREIQVPTKVRYRKEAIDVPTEVKVPEKNISLDEVGKQLGTLISRTEAIHKKTTGAKTHKPDKNLQQAQSRGHSQGSWQTSEKKSSRQKKEHRPKSGGRKYCPRCRAEYYEHVERCADCRVKLISAEEIARLNARTISPILDNLKRSPGRAGRGRSMGSFRNRR